MPDPRIYQPTPLGDAPAPVPSWVQYEEEEKQRRRDEEAATRADAEKTARDLFALGFGDGSRLYPHHPGAGTGAQPSTADIQQTWSENVDPTRVAEHPDRREDYNLDIVGSVLGAGQRVPILNPETGEYESGEFQPHIPEPPFRKYKDLNIQERMEHIFHGVGVAMEEDPDFADDVNLDINRALYRKIPILGSYQEAGESITLAQRSQNIVDGKGTKRDYFEIAKKMHNSSFWEKQATTGQRAAGNIANVGKYGVEFSMTAGTNALAKEVGQELAEAVVKKTGIMNILKDMTEKTVKGLTGGQTGLKRAAIMGTPAGINTYAQQRFGPSNLEATEDGGYKMAEQKDSAIIDGLEAAFMAQGELIIETLPLGKITAGVKNKFLKWFGQEVAEEVASIPKFRGVQYNAAIGSFIEEMGEERLTEVFNTFVTRDTANLGITGLQGDWQRDAMDEAIALSAPQAFFAAGKLGKRARSSRTVPDMPTAPPQLERTETPVPSWQQEIVPAVDTLADPLPLTQAEVESKIDSLATDNLSSRRDFELVELPDGGTLLDSYPNKASREEFLEKRRAEMAPVAPIDDATPLAELGEAEQDSALEGQLEAPELMAEEASIEPIKPPPVIEQKAPIEPPPVIEEEAPAEEESTPEENAVAVERIGKIDVMRVFPGRKVTEASDGNFDVHFEGGRWRVLLKDKINLTKKQLTAIYNDYINTGGKFRTDPMGGKDQTFQQAYPTVEDFLKDNNVTAKGTVRSSTDAERAADATWDVLGTIEVAVGRGTDSQIKALAHEAVHAAHLSGLWTDKEWAVLVKAYSNPSSTTRQQSEDIANASQNKKTAWEDPGFMDRMVDWMNRMLSKIGLKELSPQAARNMFFRSSLFNRRADTSSRVDKVPSDQAPMAMAESDIDPAKPRTLRHSDAKFGDPDYMDALVFEILLDEKQYDVAGRHYDKMTKEANDKADAERKAKGLAKKRKALPYYQMTREEFEETGEVLYHGTSRLFDEFDWEKAKTRTGGSQKELSDFKSKQTGTEGNLSRFYFTDNKRVAETFAHETGGMIEVNLTEVIMYEERVYGQTQWDNEEQGGDVLTAYKAAIRKAMKAKNLDLKYMNEDGELVDAKDPDDIKDFWWWEEGVSILLYPSGNKPRVIETKVYGRTLDLREGKKRPDNFPSKLENVLGTLSYQHEYSPMLIKWARDNGYGKIRVEDHGTSGGESIIGLQEFIGHKADPHREIVQRALNAGHDVPTEASSSYEGIQAEDGPTIFAMAEPAEGEDADPKKGDPKDLDWRGDAEKGPLDRIRRAVPTTGSRRSAYLDADRTADEKVITNKERELELRRRRSGTAAEVQRIDDEMIEKFLDPEYQPTIFDFDHIRKIIDDLQINDDPKKYELAIQLGIQYRDKKGDAARITASGRDPESGLKKVLTKLKEAIFMHDKKVLARIAKRKKKDPVKRAAGERALEKEHKRIAAIRKYMEKLGYEWTDKGFRELTRNRRDMMRVIFKAVRSKKSRPTQLLNIVSEAVYMNLLSGFDTLFRNGMSNIWWGGAMEMEELLASLVNQTFKNNKDIIFSDYLNARRMKGDEPTERDVINVFKTAMSNGWVRWTQEYGPLEEMIGVGERQKFEMAPAIPGEAGRAMRMALGLGPMAATDQFAKTLFTHFDIGRIAQHMARVEALEYAEEHPGEPAITQDEIDARALELISDTESKAWVAAMESALHKTFQDDGGPLSKGIIDLALKAKRLPNGGGFVLEQLFILFVRTPVRFVGNVSARTPFLGTLTTSLPKMIQNRLEGRPVFLNVNRELVSQLGVLLVFALLMSDDEDPEEGYFGSTGARGSLGKDSRKFHYQAIPTQGQRIGKTWYKYDKSDPMAVEYAMLNDIVTSIKGGRGWKGTTADAGKSLLLSLQDKTFLRAMGDISKSIESEDKGQRFYESSMTRLLPGLASQTLRHLQDDITTVEADTTTEGILRRMAIKQGPKIYTSWGEPAKRNRPWFTPAWQPAEQVRGDRVFIEWNKKNVGNEKFPSQFDKTYKVDGNPREFELPDFAEFQRTAGSLAHKLVMEFVSESHAQKPDLMTVAVTKYLEEQARTEVKNYWKENGNWDVAQERMIRTIHKRLNKSSMLDRDSYRPSKKPKKTGDPNQVLEDEIKRWEELGAGLSRYKDWYKNR